MTRLRSLARALLRLSPSLASRRAWSRFKRTDATLRLIDEIVRKGDFVIDVGAAEGLHATRLSQLVGRKGLVFAFEPNPAQFSQLEAAVARRSNARAYPLGLTDRQGEGELHVPVLGQDLRAGLGSLSVPSARAGIDHRVVSVSLERMDAVLSADLPPPAFLKCDVEGHELAVLRGGEETLRSSRPTILIEIEQRHQDGPIQRTFDYLQELGYAGYSVHEHELVPLDQFRIERDQLAFLGESFQEVLPAGYVHNFLFVPPGTDMEPLAAAVRTAP